MLSFFSLVFLNPKAFNIFFSLPLPLVFIILKLKAPYIENLSLLILIRPKTLHILFSCSPHPPQPICPIHLSFLSALPSSASTGILLFFLTPFFFTFFSVFQLSIFKLLDHGDMALSSKIAKSAIIE